MSCVCGYKQDVSVSVMWCYISKFSWVDRYIYMWCGMLGAQKIYNGD